MDDAKIKDLILKQIKEKVPLKDIDELDKYLPELETDGYVKVSYLSGHKPYYICLTHEGEHFIEYSGYVKQRKADRKSKLSAKAWAAIGAVGGSVLTELIHILVERLTK